MKLKSLVASLVAASGLLVVGAAQASDGTITFSGTVVATTCTINGGAGAAIAVALPPVDKSALASAGQTAAPTPIPFTLTTCPATTAVHTLFEIGTNVDTATGNLKNTATGGATGVEIGLLNPALQAINIATQTNDGAGTGLTTSAAGAATLIYYAQYVATAAATSGAVSSSVTYSIVYN